MGHRKSPRVHLRFETNNILDRIEIWANRKGEKLIPWAKNALVKQARNENTRELVRDAADFSALEALVILRELAGEELTQRAKTEVEAYVEGVREKVANDFS